MMTSGAELIGKITSTYPGASIRQVFPFLRCRIVSSDFAGCDDAERESRVATSLDMDVAALRHTGERLFLRFELLADEGEDPAPLPSSGHTWLGTFADGARRFDPTPGVPPVAHFYGFKGGQGRTTVVAFTAMELARDGLKVLVVDLDAEAPSLDLVFGVGTVAPEATLVGMRAGLVITPMAIGSPRGSVSLLAFRPSDKAFDMDATALAFEAAVHAPSSERLALMLRDGLARQFDAVLLDHRTGLGPTVPAWVRTLPGPVVAFDRLDGQSGRATRDVERMWIGLENPGMLVSYAASTSSPPESFRDRGRGEAWPWLEALARAKSERAEQQLGPEDVEDHWILWPDDNAFRRRVLPQRDEVGGGTRDAIARLREILGLGHRKATAPIPQQVLHPSGATDQGLFIATEALRDLCQPASTIRFVFGRKGTGKTRLLSELVRRGVGEPLVVAEDETVGGLPSGDVDLKALLALASAAEDLDGLWWTLLRAGLKARTTSADSLRAELQVGHRLATGVEVRALARTSGASTRVFLIDGLETMSPRAQARELIQALLRVASALEQDPVLRARASLRIFLRSDIARWGFENFEQQSHGKTIELSWSTQTIFNFVLSRLPHLPWMASAFPSVVEHVTQKAGEIEQGALTEDECVEQLLEIFPAKLGRLNLNTSTFLRTYFSDDPSGEVSYYPRVYHTFLESIDKARAPLDEGRIKQEIILRAHDEASEAFLTQVRQELRFLTPLSDGDMNRLINALNGHGTPFVARALRREIRNSLKLPLPDIEAAFDAMKEIGMFEQHPKLSDQWRVGRLFKSALKMKYSRGA